MVDVRACATLLLFGLAGCFQSSGEGTPVAGDPGRACTSCGRTTTSGGAGGTGGKASTSSGTSSSGGGTTGASGSGATSSGGGGSSGGIGDAGCPEVFISARLFDGLSDVPIIGANVQALDANGVPIPGSSALTGANGVGVVCVPRGKQATFTATATNYPPMFLENVVLQTPLTLGLPTVDGGDENGLPLLSTETLGSIAGVLSPALSMEMAAVIVSLDTVAAESPCLAQKAGWRIGATNADGGAIGDGGYVEAYLGEFEVPDPQATLTTSSGVALIYNIDPALTSVRITAVNTNADAGDCPLQNGVIGLTGQVDANSDEASYAPVFMP